MKPHQKITKEENDLIEDVIERKKIEFELRLSQFMIDRTGDAVLWVGPEGKIIYINESSVILLDYDRDEILHKRINVFVPEKPWKEQWEKIKKFKFSIFESYYIKKGGHVLPAEISINYVSFKNKEYGCVCIHDISKNRETDVKLKIRTIELERQTEELKKFQLAVENASDYIAITDSKGIIIYTNKAAEDITGYNRKEIIGQKTLFWKADLNHKYYKKIWETIKDNKSVFIGEINSSRKDGHNYIAEIHISPILDKEKNVKFYIAIERDITKAKEIDRAKSEFVSLASHQLRTPLATINWYIEILLSGESGELNEEQKEYLEEIYGGSKKMVKLVRALLNVSRIELGTFVIEPKRSNILKIADDVINELSPQIKNRQIKLVKKYHKIPLIKVDPNLMRIVFQNLLSNSVKYVPLKGKVGVEISLKKENNDNATVLIKIYDNGCGIPLNQQSKIFAKLFRANNAKEIDTEGTGLGLYIVKSIIEHAEGKVWFKSKENKGTSFYVSIPLSGMKRKKGTREIKDK